MDQNKNDLQLMTNMIMCGDHPSVTKTELNAKESKQESKEKENDVRKLAGYGRVTPTASRTEHGQETAVRSRAVSEHVLRRPARARVERADAHGRALVQAALGSFRWPPYLLCAWLLVLLTTHALHCLVALLERALPAIRKFSQYLRAWTEQSWRADSEYQRLCPIALACATGALYALYGTLYAVHAVAVWTVEPICDDDTSDAPRVIDYTDDVTSKMDLNMKQ